MRQTSRPDESGSLLETFVRRLRELTGRTEGDAGLRETLEELIEDTASLPHDQFTREERTLLLNALSFGELRVDDVMIPRADIDAVDATADLGEVVKAMQRAAHTRLVVFRDNLDDVLGIVHLRDLLPFWGDGQAFRLTSLVREVLVVPPSMRVMDLLLEMRATHHHVAVVVDEFGGTDGLVTIEDLAEEIVGEIHDEQQKLQTPQIVENEDGSIDADGRVYLEDLEARLDLKLLSEAERDEADTLGGLIFTMVDRVPARGELVSHEAGLQFEIVDADPRRIKRVRIRPSAGGHSPTAEQMVG